MKKLLILLSATLFSVSVFATQFTEGTHYTVLNVPKASKPVVTEYFSFYCGGCYQFEPLVEELKRQLPEDATFQKVHVSFLGQNMAVSMAKAYATMVVLKVEDELTMPMFNQIHQVKRAPKNVAEIRQLFVANGVEGEDFDAVFNGFVVNSMQRRFDKQFDVVGLKGVPGIVVNDKYVIQNRQIESADQYYQLVKYLLTL